MGWKKKRERKRHLLVRTAVSCGGCRERHEASIVLLNALLPFIEGLRNEHISSTSRWAAHFTACKYYQ